MEFLADISLTPELDPRYETKFRRFCRMVKLPYIDGKYSSVFFFFFSFFWIFHQFTNSLSSSWSLDGAASRLLWDSMAHLLLASGDVAWALLFFAGWRSRLQAPSPVGHLVLSRCENSTFWKGSVHFGTPLPFPPGVGHAASPEPHRRVYLYRRRSPSLGLAGELGWIKFSFSFLVS